MKRSPLITYIDPKKLNQRALQRVNHLVRQYNHDDMRSSVKHYPLQVDANTYKLLKNFKHKYDAFFYDSIHESLLLMASLLKK